MCQYFYDDLPNFPEFQCASNSCVLHCHLESVEVCSFTLVCFVSICKHTRGINKHLYSYDVVHFVAIVMDSEKTLPIWFSSVITREFMLSLLFWCGQTFYSLLLLLSVYVSVLIHAGDEIHRLFCIYKVMLQYKFALKEIF